MHAVRCGTQTLDVHKSIDTHVSFVYQREKLMIVVHLGATKWPDIFFFFLLLVDFLAKPTGVYWTIYMCGRRYSANKHIYVVCVCLTQSTIY
jgi:hypothetical protein